MRNRKIRKKSADTAVPVRNAAQRHALEEKKKALEAAKNNERAHRKRVNSASSKRALPAAFTKGYYRFAKEYPSTVTENGDRLNETPKHELPSAAVMISISIALLLFFSLAYIVTDTVIGISEQEPLTQAVTEAPADIVTAQHVHAVEYDINAGSVEQAAALCTQAGYNAVCIDYKDDYGYINFISPASTGDSAQNATLNANQTVAALHEKGLKVIMRVSCLTDTAAANANYTWAALTGENGRIWYDSESKAWLNPYHKETIDYITNIVYEASACGSDYVLLDNVCFSPQTKSGNAFYPGEATSSLTANSVLRQLIDYASQALESSKLILSCQIQGFTGSFGESYAFYGGNMLETKADISACDLRLSKQSSSLDIGSSFFANAADIPYVFVLTAAEYAISTADNDSQLFAVLEQSDTVENELNAVSAAGIDNYIIMESSRKVGG